MINSLIFSNDENRLAQARPKRGVAPTPIRGENPHNAGALGQQLPV